MGDHDVPRIRPSVCAFLHAPTTRFSDPTSIWALDQSGEIVWGENIEGDPVWAFGITEAVSGGLILFGRDRPADGQGHIAPQIGEFIR